MMLQTRLWLTVSIACGVLANPAAAFSSALFTVAASGTPGNANITLCLNGLGPTSCQNYAVAALDLSINTTTAAHEYTSAGIKLNTTGYGLTGCTPSSNGYCLFTASDTQAASISLSSSQYALRTIGNANNAPDFTGFGQVAYVYQIGQYDVTIAQYTAFLNAVAKTDTYGLYNTSMGTDLNSAGISRSGVSGSYRYAVMSNGGNSANRPITYVDWFNAVRFANWMANGQPSGVEDDTTTEDGAYALDGATSGNAVVKNTTNPNTDAAPTFYIPTENEWYKAAYYSPNLNSGAGGYYLYATQSDSAPGNTIGNAANQANYFTTVFAVTRSSDYLSGAINYLTAVGAFSSSASYYGTFDQNGNVWQWNDLDGSTTPYRGLRGGYWFSGSVPFQSALYSTDALTRADSGLGFRLASPVS